MAEEPQPTDNPPQPTAAEQKQEAAALSNLSTHADDDDARGPSKEDTAALGAALSSLSVDRAGGAGPGEGGVGGGGGSGGGAKAAPAEVKKVKIDAADVGFLVDELEVSKKKATEMLQACQGDRLAALRTYILPPVKA